MGAIASLITSLTSVYSTVYSGADQRKHQSSGSLAFVRGTHRGPVNSPHKWPVTRKMFPFDDVIIMNTVCRLLRFIVVLFHTYPCCLPGLHHLYYNAVIMSAMASQVTSLTIFYSTVYSGTDERNITGEFPAQRASNAENVSIWWRHHVTFESYKWLSNGVLPYVYEENGR